MIVFFEYIAVGMGGSLILIFLAKIVMAEILQRKNNYYDDEYDWGGEDNA